jgi:hypothetical protein
VTTAGAAGATVLAAAGLIAPSTNRQTNGHNMTLRRSLLSLWLPSATLALAACAGGPGVSMKPADRVATRVVSVSTDIKLPDQFSYQERGAGIGALFGVAGALVEASARSSEPPSEATQMQALLKSNNIVVPAILRAEFIRAANARGGIQFSDGAVAADAELFLTINVFGFGRTHLLGGQLHPVLNVTASMKRRDGSLVWQKTDFITPSSPDNQTAFTFDEYRQDPAKLSQTLSSTAAALMKYIAADLPN